MLHIVGAGQIADGNTLGAGGVNHFSVANVNSHMRDSLTICVLQENQISGLELAFGHVGANLVLLGGGTGQVDSALLQHVLDVAGTVEAVGGCSAPYIRNADVFLSVGYYLGANGAAAV